MNAVQTVVAAAGVPLGVQRVSQDHETVREVRPRTAATFIDSGRSPRRRGLRSDCPGAALTARAAGRTPSPRGRGVQVTTAGALKSHPRTPHPRQTSTVRTATPSRGPRRTS